MHVACQPRHPVGVRRYVGGISQVFDEFWLVYVPPEVIPAGHDLFFSNLGTIHCVRAFW